jgi:hypothetical protein
VNPEQEAQVIQSVRIYANIHFAERKLEHGHTALETALKGFSGEQATLYATMTQAQEAHWQKLAEQKP